MSTLVSRLREAISQIGKGRRPGSYEPSPSSAYGLLDHVLGTGRNPPMRQRHDLLESYSRLPWLRAIISRIGYAVAATPWDILIEMPEDELLEPAEDSHYREGYRTATMRQILERGVAPKRSKLRRAGPEMRAKLRRQKHAQIFEIEDHPLLDLLQNFNAVMTGMAAFKLTQAHLDLVGEAFWLKERNAFGQVTALWPLAPSWIESTPTPSRPTYWVSWQAWRVNVPDSEIVWFTDNDPARPYWRGTGTGAALGDELETDEYAAKHTKREFFNNAVPELLVTAEGLSEGETRRLERDWKHKNRGFFKSLQIYFLNRKVDVKPLGQSFRSLQLIDLRKFERDMIIEVFGVPPEILGIVNESKRATIDAADFLFSRWVLQPRLELIRCVLQERLVPDFDDRLVIDYDSPIQEDRDRQLNAAKAAPWTLSIDEWRQLQGFDHLPDNRGMVYMAPGNIVPTAYLPRDEHGTLIPTEAPGSEPGEPGEEPEPGEVPEPGPESPESPEPPQDVLPGPTQPTAPGNQGPAVPAPETPAPPPPKRARMLRNKALAKALEGILDENIRLSS